MALNQSLRDAVAHHNAGRLEKAGEIYVAILKEDPRQAEANFNMGVLAVQMNQPAAALPFFETALDADPTRAKFWVNYIDALFRAGQPDDARQILDLAKQQGMQGGDVDALEARFAHVSPTASKSSAIHPRYAETRALAELYDQRLYLEVEVAARQITQRFPQSGFAWKTLGAAYLQLNRHEDALTALNKAIDLLPNDPYVYYCAANALCALGQLQPAEAGYRKAIALNPDFAEAFNNLGAILKDFRKLDEAEACFRRALEINPNLTNVFRNLSNVLQEQGRLVEAEDWCRRALLIEPNDGDLHQTLANHLAYLSTFDQVVTESNAALQLRPDDEMIWEQRLYTFSYHPDLSAEQIFAEFVRWGDRYPVPDTDFSAHDRTPGRRLRIGFVSPDFRRHTSRFFFWPLFANHDHAAVELFAYSNVCNEDDVTQKFKPLFEHWRNIRGVADHDVARMIREDRIDILVDGCSHMQDDRLGVFTLKPAPIQATWLGSAWTTGLKQVDYVLFDPYLAPEGTLARESIVRLPHCFIAYQPEGNVPVAPTPALKNGFITFGYSGRSERLNHHTFRVWGELLRRMPDARMIFDYRTFADPATQNHYRQLMGRHGMDMDRVVMRRSANIFDGLSDFDVLLDCFPHSGGTMLFDALWMGVPCLTLAGRPPLGRICTTLLSNLGMTDWIARSHDEYIAKAIELTQDVEQLATLRAGLRARMQASAIMDGKGFARDVEAAYRWMYQCWIQQPVR